jgi:two-component system, NtrC family, sensor histidine kinase HydH
VETVQSNRLPVSKTPPPPGFEEIQHEALSRLFGRVTLVRLWVVPVVAVLVVWLLIHPVVPWRRGVLVPLGLVAAALFIHEVWRHRRRGLGRRAFTINFAFASVGQAMAALATGGIESPFFFAMFPIAFVAVAVVESPLALVLVGVQMAEVWLMAWVKMAGLLPLLNPGWFGGDLAPGWNDAHVLWTAGFASVGLCVVAFLGRGIRASFQDMVRRGLQAREETLRLHRDRAHELAALSGEIAHELKNPLASIKGLAALLAQDAPAGKPAERLQVLRREVDRMQVILDEFLNFSRPLVPLAVEQVDPSVLLAEVAQMHEGVAHERGVRVLVTAEAGTLHCDPRKLKQAIINLVQNAIEASPSETAVEIALEQGEDLRIRVLDRGPGVEPSLADKVFEAGVTSKPRGSGLGLTIARALARQHGGDLSLSPREGGGSVAEIRLPLAHR